jgi:hydrogenase maturation protease
VAVTGQATDTIAVIGCGNPNRTDDGAGLEVVRQLSARQSFRDCANVHLLDAGTSGMEVMFAARGCTSLIVIDACRTGAEPGTVFEIPGREVETRLPHSFNLHDFRWDHALYAGRQIYREAFPEDVIAFLIEARSIELGCGLSPDIAAVVPLVARTVEDRVEQRLRDRTLRKDARP